MLAVSGSARRSALGAAAHLPAMATAAGEEDRVTPRTRASDCSACTRVRSRAGAGKNLSYPRGRQNVRLSRRRKAVGYEEVGVRLGHPGLQRENASVQGARRDVGRRKCVQRDPEGGIENRAVVVGVSHVGVGCGRGMGRRNRGRRLAATRRRSCGDRSDSQGIKSRATEPLGRQWRCLDASERRGQVMPAKRTSRLIEPNVPGTSGTSRQRSPDHAQPHPASSTKISKTPGSSGSAGDGGVWPLVWAIRARRLARSIAVAPASWATGGGAACRT